ncbi:translation initiation factor eIF4E [Schizosaccharomyces cryophilus OY26]|uniref:Translation initiation factor eIF4E n=1 Tax=Schizosaccharomyces cryophilus (strain OY26 / ATCC MYA-4695 / CBS 11777 / NBRC 106824 / NRRL Y48691) TaxID=653667 RepID=S9XGF0_SCHCR|nr:translation initiation factor eIF4E [Schizosaccharomyces cryophilus OY26]EPY52756.1 translation initiation factor eIF4E [Schizosaccharomyces cryophilus OY26]
MQTEQQKEPQTASNAVETQEETAKTIFDDKLSFNLKHPLARPWTLWFLMPPTPGLEWNELQKNIITFNSVEEFWGIHNNINAASSLPIKSDYSFFREGVRPEWEDIHNKNGGKWAFQNKGRGGNALDEMWLTTVLSAIGETLDPTGEEVMGVVVNMRKGFYRLAVWTKTCTNREILLDIGNRFKQILNLPRTETIEFSAHEDSSKSGSTRAKTRMSV